jgi:hypothetical protein
MWIVLLNCNGLIMEQRRRNGSPGKTSRYAGTMTGNQDGLLLNINAFTR